MRPLLLFLLALAVTLAHCGFSVKVQKLKASIPTSKSEPFAVVEFPRMLDTTGIGLVAMIITRNTVYGGQCDYPSLLDTVSSIARGLGANVMRIDEHVYPTVFGSGCHRIRASLFRVADATPYEEEIVWSKDRPLRVLDFRGDTARRPFAAASSCGIRYAYYAARYTMSVVIVEAYFDHDGSYFKTRDDNSKLLRHEQLHFDIAELYARRLRSKLMGLRCSYLELEHTIRPLSETILRELNIEQDRYDADVYPSPERRMQWEDSIAARLAALDEFKEARFEIALDNKIRR